MYVLQDFSSLKNIELVLDEDQFSFSSSSTTDHPWVHAFQEEEFAHLNIVKHVGALRGVKKLTIEAGRCYQADSETKKQMWQTNIDALQNYLNSTVTAAKSTTTAAKPKTRTANPAYVELPPPLYPGSRVSGTESALITPTIRLVGSTPSWRPKSCASNRTICVNGLNVLFRSTQNLRIHSKSPVRTMRSKWRPPYILLSIAKFD